MQPFITISQDFLTVDDQSPGGGILSLSNEGDHLLITHRSSKGEHDYSIPMDYIEKLLER